MTTHRQPSTVYQSAVVLLVWAGCSALCLSAVGYLGASNPEAGEPVKLALFGAGIGTVAGVVLLITVGVRRGMLLAGVLFGFVVAIAYGVVRGQ